MAAAAETRGLKRICMGCGTRFYDFNKRPIVCPSCKAEFMIEVKTKGRRGKAVANDDEVVVKAKEAEVAGKETEEIEIVEGEEDVVSLEEVDENDDDDDDDLALDDDIGDLEDLEKDGAVEEEEEPAKE